MHFSSMSPSGQPRAVFESGVSGWRVRSGWAFAHKPVPKGKINSFPQSTGVRATRAMCILIKKVTVFQFSFFSITG